jgi:hypothetical protein
MTSGRSPVLLVALICAIAPMAHARLGESETQSEIRYGAAVETMSYQSQRLLEGAVERTYVYQGWRIRAAFLKGKAVRLAYTKEHRADSASNIQPDEAKAVLEGERGSGEWKATSNQMTYSSRWVNTNGNIAYLSPTRLVLTVETPDAEAHTRALREAREQKRKESIPKF